MEIARKVDKVLKILSSISVIREAGLRNPALRVLTARREGPVTLKATFHQDPKSQSFVLTFNLEVGPQATVDDVILHSRILTDMKRKAPSFLAEESLRIDQVIVKRMSTILPPPPDYSVDD